MHRKDLSPFSEHGLIEPELARRELIWFENARYIGWLDASEPFTRGHVPADLVTWLVENYASMEMQQSRGSHRCRFCGVRSEIVVDGERVPLGSAELLIKTVENRAYVAPDLLIHYLRDHDYQPPSEFLDDLQRRLRKP